MNEDWETVRCSDLDAAISGLQAAGYRLDMIAPADSPNMAMLSKNGNVRRLELSGREARASITGDWIPGRAGMEYRDLITERLGGRLIASHIRLTQGGEVPDYVHYHKVRFQMIYCVKGAIRVAYEDQGPAFWLRPGDCVLQPPEIRHRVLEAAAGSEVIEIGVPAVHETWVEHKLRLPTDKVDPERDFRGQRFLRHIASEADWTAEHGRGSTSCSTSVSEATNGLVDVRVLRLRNAEQLRMQWHAREGCVFLYCLKGGVEIDTGGQRQRLSEGAAMINPYTATFQLSSAFADIMAVTISALL